MQRRDPNRVRSQQIEHRIGKRALEPRGPVGRRAGETPEENQHRRKEPACSDTGATTPHGLRGTPWRRWPSVDPWWRRPYTPAGRRRLGLRIPDCPILIPRSCIHVKRAVTSLLALLVLAVPTLGQSPDAGDGMRIGVSLGGISTLGVTVELFRDSRSLDLSLGTWSFRDLSVSAVAKQYFGAGAARPVVGAGLWMVASWVADERTGLALVFRAPIGVDWAVEDSRHSVGAFLNVNRGLWVRRSDPEDRLPLNRRLVPLPELYYRYRR